MPKTIEKERDKASYSYKLIVMLDTSENRAKTEHPQFRVAWPGHPPAFTDAAGERFPVLTWD